MNRHASYKAFGTFRLILALMVVAQHVVWIAPPGLAEVLRSAATGNIAVLTFFALSGFIMAEAADQFYVGRPWAFAANRALRIIPPYLLALALSVSVHLALFRAATLNLTPDLPQPGDYGTLFSPGNLIRNCFFIVPFFNAAVGKPTYSFIPFAWAIAVEGLFYLWIFAVLLISKNLRRFHATILLYSGALAAVAYLLYRLGGGPATLRFGAHFSFGVCAFYAFAQKKGTWSRRALSAMTAALWLLCLFDYSDYDLQMQIQLGRMMSSLTAQYAVLGFTLLLVIALPHLRLNVRLRNLDCHLGRLSYPIYLNQFTVIIICLSIGQGPSTTLLLFALAATVALSLIMERITEPAFAARRDALRGNAMSALVNGFSTGSGATAPVRNRHSGTVFRES